MAKKAEECGSVQPCFRIVVIIPAYNEQSVVGMVVKNVIARLKELEIQGLQSEVIVIDDGSTDLTSMEAQQAGALVVRHAINCGVGAATGTGLKAALIRNADLAITLDADGQHNPNNIDQLMTPILEDTADIVIGSRLINPTGMPLDRRIINWGANLITRLLFGVWTSDSQSGFRAFNRKSLELIKIRTNRWESSSEILGEAARLKLRLAEAPIEAIYTDYSRRKGQKNSNGFAVLFKLIIRKIR